MRQNGRATTLLRGVLTSEALRDFEALTATLECFEENLADLFKLQDQVVARLANALGY